MGSETTVLSPEEIMNRQFTGVLRGFDADQVRAFLADVAGAHEELLTRIAQLESETEALSANHRAEHEGITLGEDDPLLDEMRRATSQVIIAAQDAATEMRLSAEVEAEQHVGAAREEAAGIVAEARRAADEARQTVLDGARREADEMLEEAHRERERVRAEIDEFRRRREEFASSLERVLAGARDLADELLPPEED
jgi:DivIVA domain-containing protein